MKILEYDATRSNYYRNNPLPAIDGGGAGEDDMMQQPHAEVEGKAVDKDPANLERDLQVDAWMTNIKAFIRSIDVSKL